MSEELGQDLQVFTCKTFGHAFERGDVMACIRCGLKLGWEPRERLLDLSWMVVKAARDAERAWRYRCPPELGPPEHGRLIEALDAYDKGTKP